ncbi:MAG: phosphoenolpyruvate carboxykinase (ATP) [Planctomycetes bacterium]|nr:phosphoenolpyruvate carboxykinase (ATP) [Planctomycetota bacterium]
MHIETALDIDGLAVSNILRNPSPAKLYEEAIIHDRGVITSNGALLSMSGSKTGRSPKDKRIVEHPDSSRDIWWGDVNIPLSEQSFVINRQRALDYLNIRPRIYVIDGYAGWDPKYRLKIRVVCARPYHALFMHNMLIRPSAAELATFGKPDYTIYNAGEFPANLYTKQMTSKTSVELSFEHREFVILGTEYAGEMKKGVFTVMNYLMPKRGVLSMHCSANEGASGDVTLFFGLSGTGKTTLSADVHRQLIGDDEHCWSDEGVFNIEGGCYAKCVNLSAEREPEIFQSIRFGAILENTIYDDATRQVDYTSQSITENTRCSYPIEFIPRAKVPCMGGHPQNIIFLTADAFGVLPPVAKLTPAQAMYHFISGYTAKVAGTEVGVTEPQATFSACFGAAFMVWHPTKYASMLAERMREHSASAWLVNTGWTGGPYSVGARMKLAYTRAIIDAIHNGTLNSAPTIEDPVFGLHIPTQCPNVPSECLVPRECWPDKTAYDHAAARLAGMFQNNFSKYADGAPQELLAAQPRVR